MHEKFLSVQKLNVRVCSCTFDSEICACLLFNTELKINQHLESYSVEIVCMFVNTGKLISCL